MKIKLHPIVSSGLHWAKFGEQMPGEIPGVVNKKRRIKEVTMYQCPICGDLHDEEDDAIDCCDDEDESSKKRCQVCYGDHTNIQGAADCCLWKSIDHATRFRIADQVENGMGWLEAINAEGFEP